ncbi:MAG TPA: tetratricopeptide repeat protein [Rhodopila sp.]
MSTAEAQAEYNLGLHLHLHDRMREAEPHYQTALAIDGDLAEAWINLGLVVLAQGRAEEALSCQRAALHLNPENADALNNLGMAHYAMGHVTEAENCFRAALRLDAGHANATLNLGATRQILGHVEEAEGLFRRALALGVEPARAKSNLALALMEQVRPEEAEQCCRDALVDRPDYPEARTNLALALLMLGRLDEGWREYEARWLVEAMDASARPQGQSRVAQSPPAEASLAWRRLAEPPLAEPPLAEPLLAEPSLAAGPVVAGPVVAGPLARCSPKQSSAPPRWTGQQLHGETVLLYAEQGFGDTLQFCRYAPMVAAAGGRVILVVPRALCRLMATLDGVAEVLCEDDGALPPFDYHCPLLSLPFAFGTTMATIPGPASYLRADPSAWAEFLAGCPGLKIGVVWAGRSRTGQPQAVAIDRRRSMRLSDMAPLFSVPGCSFVSLQAGVPALQLQSLAPAGPLDVSRRLNDWADTAALIAGLDLVIAVDTAVAHLAGALGRPVWMLNRFDSCWRWFLHRDDTPWYPSMRIFRQSRRGDWAGVIASVRERLTIIASGRI